MVKRSLSLLIPAYNEEKLIVKTVDYYYKYLKRLKSLDSFEIIICVNGSTDRTEEISKKISKKIKEVKCIVTKEKGMGIGLTLGIKEAKKEVIVYMPADGDFDVKFIGDAIKIVEDKIMVVGSRKKAGKYEGKSFLRKFISYGFNFVLILTLSKSATEAASVKMFTNSWAKNNVKDFKNYGFEWQVEIIYFALKDGLKIISIPSRIFSNRDGSETSVSLVKTSLKITKSCLKYGLKYRLSRIFK